jgi:hypothetical protein
LLGQRHGLTSILGKFGSPHAAWDLPEMAGYVTPHCAAMVSMLELCSSRDNENKLVV